jgi:hypothetical protein
VQKNKKKTREKNWKWMKKFEPISRGDTTKKKKYTFLLDLVINKSSILLNYFFGFSLYRLKT